ncbi:MAG: FtsX-like permease family protein [Lachnospiraceae bacterium]|nr:FtsX-like permease family protein [Lachnospiraceae bacterium]
MLGIMLQKMWHKRWMNLSLLLGCILLVATVVSFPLYQNAAYDRMLQDEFRNFISTEGKFPTAICMKTVCMKSNAGSDKSAKTMEKIEKKMKSIPKELGVPSVLQNDFIYLQRAKADSDMNREDGTDIDLCIGGMRDMLSHVNIISGEPFSESGITEDGRIEVILSQECMTGKGLLVGEELTFSSLKLPDGSPVRIVIKGVFKADGDSEYWQMPPSEYREVCFTSMDTFRELFTGENAGRYTLYCNYYQLLDYKSITADQAHEMFTKGTYLQEKGKFRSVLEHMDFLDILEKYEAKIKRISATLTILQIPVLIMLAAFLFMISGQMYEMEKNEISVIKSRGSSRGQIFRLYFYQGIVLTLIGGAFGIPLGTLFSKVLGSVRNFLDFDSNRVLNVSFTGESAYYALGAMLITLLSITIPAIGHSKVSIVKLKQSRNVKKKSWWKKLYLDILLLGISLYGYYSFHKNMGVVSGTVMEGQTLDPLLYISSSLFIIGMGLLFLRVQPYLIKLIYLMGQKLWKPASYISFMESMKQSSKQQLIILFLIMTVSLGMYHSTVARTILDNAINNTTYADATDMILAERWEQMKDENGAYTGKYIEPDYKRFATMDFAKKYTRVYYDEDGYVTEGKTNRQSSDIMGIHTKEFGEMTFVDGNLNDKHYYEYLNELAEVSDGVLVSSNYRDKLGYDIGDTLYLYNGKQVGTACKIVDFFDYFPGYAPTKTTLSPDGTSKTEERFLAVTHYDLTRREYGVYPYQIWIQLKDNVDTEQIYQWIQEHDIRVMKYVNRNDDLEMTMTDPLLQGTNGILTLGFVVTIVLCAVGYLIYWIMSIKERELIFGVLRAGGFHKSEILQMLLVEQLFAGVLAVVAGIGIGWLSSVMFVPIIQLSYASATQILPLTLTMNTTDLIRLFGVIALVMVTCVAVLVSLLFHMNVTKALKLGEE